MNQQTDREARPRRQVGCVLAGCATGAGLGVALAASAVNHAATHGCSIAASRLGVCVPGGLIAAKPYVSAAVIGLLLGALIAIAGVLVWRETVAATAHLRDRAPSRAASRGPVRNPPLRASRPRR